MTDRLARPATKADVQAAVRELKRRLLARLGAGAVVVLGLLFSALHLWPPH